ncbi:major facilitator superfamily domain-containing protein [Xylariales sp. PMI_506]|nr:major facilitator superfamily domain-containing protein [Xylariales sp. PMI_506]
MGSAITSNLIEYLQQTFHVPSGPQTILPASLYLIGFVFGPLIFGPLSESYGRRPIIRAGFILYMLATLACALAPNWVSFLVFRLFTGIFAAPPNSIMGGVIADVFDDSKTRGRAMLVWSAASILGPLTAPIIAGYIAPYGWRWPIWITLMIAGVSVIFVLSLPETLASKILRVKAAKLNKEKKCTNYVNPWDINRGSFWTNMSTTMSRPLRLLFTEMILLLTCIYMAFVYSVFYMLLEIFPEIFRGIYGFSAGESGVAFTTIFVGTFIACPVSLWYDSISSSVTAKHPSRRQEYLRLPIACAGGPTFVIALLWLGWSAKPEIHWIVPLLATVPYGCAYQMIFVSMYNYISDAYGSVYGASAFAALGTTRSIAGAVIPLAVVNMLDSLGIAWSCTVLAFISLVLSFVPLCFIQWGPDIRRASKFTSKLQGPVDEGLTRSISLV